MFVGCKKFDDGAVICSYGKGKTLEIWKSLTSCHSGHEDDIGSTHISILFGLAIVMTILRENIFLLQHMGFHYDRLRAIHPAR
jgi:hypothetical protein